MKSEKHIKSFEYVFLKNDGFNGARGTRLRNDIIKINYVDGECIYRMYLNNSNEYVDLPSNSIMVSELSKITWTKDTNKDGGKFIKSDADEENLNGIIQRYNKNYRYEIYNLESEKNEISKSEKNQKREEFIRMNPRANTDNPD